MIWLFWYLVCWIRTMKSILIILSLIFCFSACIANLVSHRFRSQTFHRGMKYTNGILANFSGVSTGRECMVNCYVDTCYLLSFPVWREVRFPLKFSLLLDFSINASRDRQLPASPFRIAMTHTHLLDLTIWYLLWE